MNDFIFASDGSPTGGSVLLGTRGILPFSQVKHLSLTLVTIFLFLARCNDSLFPLFSSLATSASCLPFMHPFSSFSFFMMYLITFVGVFLMISITLLIKGNWTVQFEQKIIILFDLIEGSRTRGRSKKAWLKDLSERCCEETERELGRLCKILWIPM